MVLTVDDSLNMAPTVCSTDSWLLRRPVLTHGVKMWKCQRHRLLSVNEYLTFSNLPLICLPQDRMFLKKKNAHARAHDIRAQSHERTVNSWKSGKKELLLENWLFRTTSHYFLAEIMVCAWHPPPFFFKSFALAM